MGTTTHDLFSDADQPTPATPGSYGVPPRGFRLPEATALGAVHLQVADLGRSLAWYQEVLGFRVVRQDAGQAVLASQGSDRALLVLHERRDARPAPRQARLGLYHFAILLPDRPSLASFVRHLQEARVAAGAGDHLVSEAFYLTDPDGLGIEVYADRPRSSWHRIGKELMLATDPVDVAGLLALGADVPWHGLPAATVIGHVHLHVGNLAAAEAFYAEALGFDRMTWRYPGALFLGAGGYHHHLGTNTWAGASAQPAREDEARLLEWTIEVPLASDVDAACLSIVEAGYPVERAGPGTAIVRDPWGTRIRLRATAPG